MSSTNPKSKFTVVPTSVSSSYDKSFDTLKTGTYSSSGYSDESYSRITFKSSREAFNISPDQKYTKSVPSDSYANPGQKYQENKSKNGYSEFQRESAPKVVRCDAQYFFMHILFRVKFYPHSDCISSRALMLTI